MGELESYSFVNISSRVRIKISDNGSRKVYIVVTVVIRKVDIAVIVETTIKLLVAALTSHTPTKAVWIRFNPSGSWHHRWAENETRPEGFWLKHDFSERMTLFWFLWKSQKSCRLSQLGSWKTDVSKVSKWKIVYIL